MELRQLHMFAAIAETSSFRRAADLLHTSQPPLTVAIRKLEQELGVELFERHAKGVRLTRAGEAALPAAKAALARAHEVRTLAREGYSGEVGRLRIGFVGSSIFDLLPRLIPRFRQRYPMLELSLEEATTHDMIPRLVSGELDAGLVRLPLLDVAALDLSVVETDELVAAVPAGSRFEPLASIDLADLSKETFISLGATSILRTTALLACHDAGFVPMIMQEVPQLSTVLCLVQSGLGVALVPAKVGVNAPPGVHLLSLHNPPRIETGLALAIGSPGPAAVNFKALATELRQSVAHAAERAHSPVKTGGRRSRKAAMASS